VDAACAVLARLDRIEELHLRGAPAASILAEVEALVDEASAWAAREGDARALRAADTLRASVRSPGDGERPLLAAG
jgi:hypothetical protein